MDQDIKRLEGQLRSLQARCDLQADQIQGLRTALLLLAHACARTLRAFPPTLATEFFGLQGEAAGAALHMETNPLYTTLPDGFGEAGAKILRDLGEIVSAGGKG